MRNLFNTRVTDTAFGIAMLVLRLAGGLAMMIEHGLFKLKNFAEFADNFANPFGLGPTMSLALVVFAEFFCAMFVVLGLMTRLACIPIIITMLVVIIDRNNGQLLGDSKLPTLFLAIFTAILIAGPGKLSMDRLVGK